MKPPLANATTRIPPSLSSHACANRLRSGAKYTHTPKQRAMPPDADADVCHEGGRTSLCACRLRHEGHTQVRSIR
jgi:hypothetical protein